MNNTMCRPGERRSSGGALTGGLTGGIQVKSESLASLMAGGIAFETPEQNVPLKKRIPRFRLFTDREAANQRGTLVTIKVDRADSPSRPSTVRRRARD